jgi:hypothetical protein
MTKVNNTAMLAKEFASKSNEVDPLFVRLITAMQPSTFIIDAVTSTFVDSSTRQTRQLGAAAAAFSIGLSIYNTYEIYNLKNEIGDIRAGVEHVSQALLQEDQAIDGLTNSIQHLNSTCNILAKSFYQLEERVNKQAAFDELMLQITGHNQQVSQWGEGMTVLLHGHLSPLLIKNKAMMTAFSRIKEKVERTGYSFLRENPSSIYKEELSYIVEGSMVHVYIHIPIIERKAMDLCEYIKVPFQANPGGPFITVEADNSIFAIDEQSRNGVELSALELSQCKKNNNNIGSIYVCRGLNLERRDMSNTCLGMLYAGKYDQNSLEQSCHIFMSPVKEFAKQISRDSFVLFSSVKTKLTTKCKNGTDSSEMIVGVRLVRTGAGCHSYTADYIFHHQEEISLESDFIHLPRKVEFKLEDVTFLDLSSAYEQMSLVTKPTKRNLELVKSWLQNSKTAHRSNLKLGLAFGLTMGVSCIIIVYLVRTYLRYKRAKAGTVTSQEIEMS